MLGGPRGSAPSPARALERHLAQLCTYRVRACARSSSSGASLAPSRVVTVDSRAEGTKTLRAALVSRLTKPAAGVRRPRPTKDCERLGPEMNPSLTTNQHHHDRCSHRETIRSVRSRCGSAKPPRRDTVAEPMESQKADSSVGCGSTKEKDATATPRSACRYPHRLSETKPNCTVDTKPRNAGTADDCQSFHAVKCIIPRDHHAAASRGHTLPSSRPHP